jgi:hypothetical protein
MRARFQIDIQRCAACLLTSPLDRQNFRVLNAIVGIEPSAYNIATIVDQHRADIRVGRCQSEALLREFQCMPEKKVVGFL